MAYDGGQMGLMMERRLRVVRDAVAHTVSLARLMTQKRDRLGDELVRLGSLQELARLTPMLWRQVMAEREEEMAFWLFNVAVGLAATGEHAAAVLLLDALPGVPAGAHGRRELLMELCRCDAQLAA